MTWQKAERINYDKTQRSRQFSAGITLIRERGSRKGRDPRERKKTMIEVRRNYVRRTHTYICAKYTIMSENIYNEKNEKKIKTRKKLKILEQE